MSRKEGIKLFTIKGLYGNIRKGADYLSNTKDQKSKQRKNAKTSITDITDQYFRQFIKEFLKPPNVCYKKKKAHIEPTKAYLFLIKQFYKRIKSKNHVWPRTKIVKSDSNKKIGQVNKKFNLELLQ